MTDEEKKALKVVNNRTERLIEELKIEEEDLIDEPKIAYLITQIEANKTLLNLIEKQSKKIEDNKKYIDLHYVPYEQYVSKTNEINKKWKDKIKAKIEELKKLDFGTDLVSQFTANLTTITILQSLLEKE